MNKTARYFLLDNMFSMTAYWVSTGTVMAGLTSYYNLPLPVSNLITGFSATLPILQLLGGMRYQQTKRPDFFVRATCLAWRLLLPAVFFSVLLPPSIGMPFMVVSYFFAVATFQFSAPAQTDWMVGHVEGRVKANYYSIREMCFMLLFSAVFCVASLSLDTGTASGTLHTAFMVIGGLLTVLLAASGIYLFKLPPPAPRAAQQEKPRVSLLTPLKNRAFARVLFTNVLWSCSAMFIGSFAAMYQVRVLNLSFYEIMLWSTVANLARSIATPFMARLATRTGWKFVSGLCLMMMVGTATLWAFITPENYKLLFPFASVMGGIPYAGMGVGFLKMQVETMQEDARSVYFSVNATLNGAASFLGTTACSALIGTLEAVSAPGMEDANLKYIFVVGAVGALLSTLACSRIRSKAR